MATSVTGSTKTLLGAALAGNTQCYVRFWLRGTNGAQPRVNGTALISPQNGTWFYEDIRPDANGLISGSVYSTRDAAGTGNGEIEVGGSKTAVWYGVQIFRNGIPGPEMPVHAKNGATIDLTNVTPNTVTSVVTAPTGDTTYARLDGGNQPFTGAISAPAVTAPNLIVSAPAAQQNINGQTLNMEGASISASAAASTTADTFLSRISAGIYAIGTAIGNALGTLYCSVMGIGTTSPGATLHVSTSSTSVQRGIISEQTSADVNGAFVYLQKSRSGGAAVNGDSVGSFSAIAHDGTQFTPAARVKFTVDGAVSNGVVPMSIGFFTGTSGSGTERIHISSAGAVTFPSGFSIDTINQPAATVFAIKDNTGGTRFSIPSGGSAAATLNNTNVTGASTLTSVAIQTGIPQGSGFKHQRFGASCATAAAAGATCTSTYTWSAAFADTSYTVACTCVSQTANPYITVEGITASNFAVRVNAGSANAASCGAVHCIAAHD